MKNLSLSASLVATASLASACSYPGGTQQFVHTSGYGAHQRVTIDENAGEKMLTFAMSSRDEKFAQCVKAGDTALASKYVTEENVNKKIDGGEPIFYAAMTGNHAMTDLLVAHGAKLDVETRRGQSPAFLAAAYGHPQLARKLAQLGGGSPGDVAAGQRRNEELSAQQHENTRRGMELFGAMAGILLKSNSPTPSAEEAEAQQLHDYSAAQDLQRESAEKDAEFQANMDAAAAQ